MENTTQNSLLASLYAVTRHQPEAPLSVPILCATLQMQPAELHKLFSQWAEDGLIQKKYESLDVYCLTQKGAIAVEEAYWKTNK